MSVLQFSRKSEVFAEEPDVVEIDKPIPLKTRSVQALKSSEIPSKVKNYFLGLLTITVLLAYPTSILLSNKIGDELNFPESINQNWSSPWAGVGTQILEREVDLNGWVADAPVWVPSARLTAMPAYQMALGHAIGDFVELVNTQQGNLEDSDLSATALLLSRDISEVEIRAAIESLYSYNGGVRLHRYDDTLTAARYVSRLGLMTSWLRQSAAELSEASNSASGAPFNKFATEAVYRARARAYVAHRFLSFMQAPIGLSIKQEHASALLALEQISDFKPLLVLNGSADGILIPSHPAALYQKVREAEFVLMEVSKTVQSQGFIEVQ